MPLPELPAVVRCRCGAIHRCDIRRVVCGPGALAAVPGLLEGAAHLALVTDANTAPLAGRALTDALRRAGHTVRRVHFATRAPLVPDEAALRRVQAAAARADALVGVGSGVINDLCKQAAGEARRPYMIVATAPSMDGYASCGAALTLGGLKVTLPAAPPAWIVGDTALLSGAPAQMLRAGIGDILGKYSCLNDWRLAALVTGESFCEDIHDSVLAAADAVAADIPAILARQPAAVGRLFEALVQVGVAMSFAGNSRPASGSEHHMAHFFEVTALAAGRPCLPHGIDVGYCALLTARLRAAAAALPAPGAVAAPFDERGWMAGMRRVYGREADAAAERQLATDLYTAHGRAARRARLHSCWPAVRATLAAAAPPARMQALLQAAGFDEEAFVRFYGRAHIRQAVVWGKDLKQRYTLLNLLADLDRLEAAAAACLPPPPARG